jgi:hypothetical protein
VEAAPAAELGIGQPRGAEGSEVPKKLVSQAELSGQLKDHVTFIRASCGLYDSGHGGEAKRIATSVRVLVHDTDVSHSLLEQLGYKQTLQFLTLALPNKSYNRGPYHGLLDIDLANRVYVPKLDQVPPRPISFRDWWSDAVLKDGDGTLYTRRDLVLALANKDGGAHVDPEMDEAYERLTRENHVGYEVAVGGKSIKWRENPVFPSVRQIGHEILETLKAVPEGK